MDASGSGEWVQLPKAVRPSGWGDLPPQQQGGSWSSAPPPPPTGGGSGAGQVRFLLKNLDFLFKNLDFLFKNLHLYIQRSGSRGSLAFSLPR